MAYTEQQRALDKVTNLFGRSAFTEDYVQYRRVGCKMGLRRMSATASTWDEAIRLLQAKVEQQ